MSDPLDEAADAALRGELIVIPTDTVYGIGTRPDDSSATGRLFAAKARSRTLALPVLVPTTVIARDLAVFDGRAERLAGALWPGAVTFVLRRAPASRDWDLGRDASTIGLRVPHHPMALAVLALTGPLAVTSANRTGQPTPRDCDDLQRAFGGLVEVYLCADEPVAGAPSAVVDLTGEEPRIVREGADPATLARLLGA